MNMSIIVYSLEVEGLAMVLTCTTLLSRIIIRVQCACIYTTSCIYIYIYFYTPRVNRHVFALILWPKNHLYSIDVC